MLIAHSRSNILFLPLAWAVAFAVVTPSLAAVRPSRGPIFGYSDGQSVYASFDPVLTSEGTKLYQQPLVRSNVRESDGTLSYTFGLASDFTHMYRWRIHNGIYFGCGVGIEWWQQFATRIPLSDLDLFDDSDLISDEERERRRKKRYPHNPLLFDAHSLGVTPLKERYEKIIEGRTPTFIERFIDKDTVEVIPTHLAVYDVHADLLPLDDKRMLLFVLKKPHLEVWEGSFSFSDKFSNEHGRRFRWIGEWGRKPVEVIRADFDEPFFVAARGDDYVFVTQYGNIYVARKPVKGAKRKTEPYWVKEDQPVGRVITDLTTGKMFAFTMPLEREDGTFAKHIFFEIGDKPEAVAYDLKKVKASKAPFPLKQVRECADVLLEHKRIAAALKKATPER